MLADARLAKQTGTLWQPAAMAGYVSGLRQCRCPVARLSEPVNRTNAPIRTGARTGSGLATCSVGAFRVSVLCRLGTYPLPEPVSESAPAAANLAARRHCYQRFLSGGTSALPAVLRHPHPLRPAPPAPRAMAERIKRAGHGSRQLGLLP